MGKHLFSEFQPVSAKAFKQKIQYDLDGLDYNKTLVWNAPEGIHIKPFYHSEDTTPLPIPGHPQNWNIVEEIFILDPKVSAKTATLALSKGAESLLFKADEKFNVDELVDNLPQQELTIYFSFSFLDADFLTELSLKLKAKNHVAFLNTDIVGNLALSGNWFSNQKNDFQSLEKVFLNAENDNVIGVDLTGYHNAGANMVQQLAYTLAHVNEYFNQYGDALKTQTITFKIATGSNYFFEIAKLRALRLVFATLAEAYNLPHSCHILAVSALRNKTLYDYNTNLLRTTTEAMSAILGGADSFCNLAYDAIYHRTNKFGQRIARNQLLILKHESYFDQVANPADGAYYIEELTQQFSEKAISLFKEIEAGGGFITQLIDGKIQKKIKESAVKEQEAFDSGERTVIGSNVFQNTEDQMKNELEIFPFLKINPRKTLIEPVIPKRLTEALEQKRLEDE
ncbi:heterodimeric methylmalonyl-CoA mutase small subunit [Leeuwenhoekiella aestuarii]|uniref:Heterodimeric methylmalonyl-CoA mutase small subunit n=1 Tax=Leeuwenhoekiella aestuarii TaxID=2249426 RepID=A0A4Q0NVX4_9FLAO|nr:methylmalonyl-CoA mutase subunit beta [Leeuwenhoekiella aestuarii]RXG15339.1 heterodimeric methylmalonyl-CoA mutase small subunit [Leeuwenhoekiella aestuarii]RXG17554.1 heterodimeric methylmalonyl-CoA mutase small subunit [Leeuwenhoekiella aestuarii]